MIMSTDDTTESTNAPASESPIPQVLRISSPRGVSRSTLKHYYEKAESVPLPPTLRELAFSSGKRFFYVSSKDVGFVSGALVVRNISIAPEKISDTREHARENDRYHGVYDRYLMTIDEGVISVELYTSQMHHLLSVDTPALSDYLAVKQVDVKTF